MAHYGKFSGVQNYIALVGKKTSDLDEKLGYYDGTNVYAKSLGGFYAKEDLGIVKYHFEVGAGKENFEWSK